MFNYACCKGIVRNLQPASLSSNAGVAFGAENHAYDDAKSLPTILLFNYIFYCADPFGTGYCTMTMGSGTNTCA